MVATFIASLFAGVWFYLMLAAVGAVIGVGAWLVGRWTGLGGAAAFGVVAVLAAYTSGAANQFMDERARVKIERLEDDLAAEKAGRAIDKATSAELEKHLSEEAGIAEHNAGVIANLQKQIDAMKDVPECGVSKDFTDALKDIR